MKKKRLLIINQTTGYLVLDICNAFVNSGDYDEVILQTGDIFIRPTVPHPQLKIVSTTKYNQKNLIFRTLTWIASFIHSLGLIWFKFRDAELFIVSNPPINSFLPLFVKNKYSFLVFDVYPECLINGGFIKEDSFLSRLWAKTNLKIYNKAEKLYTISQGMAEEMSKYVKYERIKIVSLWSHELSKVEIPKNENRFRQQFNLLDKFVVMYSGNIGKGHDVDVLVDVAKILEEEKNREIFFVFIGEGWNKPKVAEKIEKYGVKNCLLLPYQSLEMLPHSLSSPDIGVVSVYEGEAKLCVPSKTYTLINQNIPLLSIATKDSELARIIEKYKIGKNFDRTEINSIKEYLLELLDNPSKIKELKSNVENCQQFFTIQNTEVFLH